MDVQLEHIPMALRARPHWVVWSYVDRDGRMTKAPRQIHGAFADSTDPATWTTFETAFQYRSQFDGVGIVLCEGLCGVDLDHCRDPETGAVAPWAQQVVDLLDSYTEISPSQTGLKVYVFGGPLPAQGRRRKWPPPPNGDGVSEIEMYDGGRYFAVTGQRVHGLDVETRGSQLTELHQMVFGERAPQPAAPRAAGSDVDLDDAQLLDRARAASNGEHFAELWDGGGPQDRSAGDQALVNMLAFWCAGDAARIDLLFRSSPRMREKWDKRHRSDGSTYGQMTIERALATCTEHYQPGVREDPQAKEADWESRLAAVEHAIPQPPHEAASEETEVSESSAPPTTETTAQPKRRTYQYTDLGNAERMRDRHGRNIRYCWPTGTWYWWDGRRWARDETGHIQSLATETVRSMGIELRQFPVGSDEAKELYKHMMKSENASRLRSQIELLRSCRDVPILPADLDADPWLFNCANGIIDLRTGELMPHRPDRMMSKLSPVRYDPAARCDEWLGFLDTVTGSCAEQIRFLQVMAGYSLTGSTMEEKLFFVYGPTRSGKSTFLAGLMAAMGDYATIAAISSFMDMGKPAANGHSEHLACLAGARLVCATEPAKGRHWDEESIKSITGGDKLRVRALHENSFEFKPQFSLCIAANDRPRVRHDNAAMWERILEIPFAISIPPENRDPRLKERLCDVRTAGPGILAWAIRGAMIWHQEGLQVPEVVQLATGVYRDEMDPLKDFVSERCYIEEGAFAGGTDLWNEYRDWAQASNIRHPLTKSSFRELLRARGLQPGHDSTGAKRGWRGIALSGSEISDTLDL